MTCASGIAFCLLNLLAERGVRDIVVAPGARSQALALAAVALERAGLVRLTVRIDERVAAFTAFGMAKALDSPAVVITTSGSAVANLYPAVVEASHSFVPLIVITADRPRELHGKRSNQTMNQEKFFSHWVRFFCHIEQDVPGERVIDSALQAALGVSSLRGAGPGPVHINVAFDNPLSCAHPVQPGDNKGSALKHKKVLRSKRETLVLRKDDPPTVIIAGTGSGRRPADIACATGWPLVAEISSGSRFGPFLIKNYRNWLTENSLDIRRAIVFGHPTLSSEIPTFLTKRNIDTIVVAPFGREFYNPSGTARPVANVLVDEDSFSGIPLGAAKFASASAGCISQDVISSDRPRGHRVTRQQLVSEIWNITKEDEILFFGSSQLIRVADSILPGKRVTVFANRGLSGIDGNLSTAAGIAIATNRTTRVLVGDLTGVHDIGALLIPLMEAKYRLQIVIGNDFGGGIFDTLEVHATPSDYKRVLYVPCRVDFRLVSHAFGWKYTFCPDPNSLRKALKSRIFPHLLEVHLAV